MHIRPWTRLPSTRSVGAGLLIPIAVAIFPGHLSAQTLTEAVEQAISGHPSVQRAINRRLGDEEGITIARRGFLPRADLNAGVGWERSRNSSTGEDWKSMNRREAELAVTYNLFDGYNTLNEVERRTEVVNSSAHSVRNEAESLALDTTAAYLDVLRDRRLVELAEQNLRTHQRIQGQIRERVQSGVGREADLSQAQARLALAQANLVAEQGNLETSMSRYQAVVGMPPGQLAVPARGGSMPAHEDDALMIAGETHPALMAARADVNAARHQHESSKSLMMPRIDLRLSGRYGENIDGSRGHDDDVRLMLQMSYNLYNGGADEARIRQTAHGIGEAQSVLDDAARAIEEEIRLAFAFYRRAEEQLRFLGQHVENTERAARAYRQQFDIGERSLLDVLDSENELFTSRRALAAGERDLLFAHYRIQYAMGGMLSALGLQAPEAAEPVRQ